MNGFSVQKRGEVVGDPVLMTKISCRNTVCWRNSGITAGGTPKSCRNHEGARVTTVRLCKRQLTQRNATNAWLLNCIMIEPPSEVSAQDMRMSWNQSSLSKSFRSSPSYRRKPVSRVFQFPGFRLALARTMIRGSPEWHQNYSANFGA